MINWEREKSYSYDWDAYEHAETGNFPMYQKLLEKVANLVFRLIFFLFSVHAC